MKDNTVQFLGDALGLSVIHMEILYWIFSITRSICFQQSPFPLVVTTLSSYIIFLVSIWALYYSSLLNVRRALSHQQEILRNETGGKKSIIIILKSSCSSLFRVSFKPHNTLTENWKFGDKKWEWSCFSKGWGTGQIGVLSIWPFTKFHSYSTPTLVWNCGHTVTSESKTEAH